MLDMRDAEAEPVKLQIQGYPDQPLHGMLIFGSIEGNEVVGFFVFSQ